MRSYLKIDCESPTKDNINMLMRCYKYEIKRGLRLFSK